MTPDVSAQMTDVFRTVFNLPDLELRDDLSADDIVEWDSLSHINLIIQIENQFQVKFTSSEISGLKDVGELSMLLDSRLQRNAA